MFRNSISNISWTEDNTALFKGIPLQSSPYDYSFTATLRALLYPRLEQWDASKDFALTYHLISRGLRHGDDVNSGIIYELPMSISSKNALTVMEVAAGSNVDDTFNKISEGFSKYVKENYEEDFTEVTKIRTFYKKTMNVLCFINPKNKSSIVLFERKGTDCFHYLQIGIPTYLPWFFEENPATELEMKIIKSLREKTPDAYLKTLQEMSEVYKLDDERVKSALGGFEKQWALSRKNDVEESIAYCRRQIEKYRDNIASLLNDMREKSTMLMGIMAKIENTECATLEYFLSNPNLVFDKAGSGWFQFYTKAYLECFDESQAEAFIDNENSIIYRNSNKPFEETERVYKAIFINSEIKIRMTACYKVDINSNRIVGKSDATYPFTEYYHNPHIQYYHCLGDYENSMTEALQNEDIVMALELCSMSTRSLNFGDSTVMQRFCSDITNDAFGSIFELPDGTVTDWEGVLKYLDEQETANTTEEKTETTKERTEEE